MNIITLPKKQYETLIRRQERVERELALLREVVKEQAEDDLIRSPVLKKWERISRDLDRGRGRSFASLKEMKAWLRAL